MHQPPHLPNFSWLQTDVNLSLPYVFSILVFITSQVCFPITTPTTTTIYSQVGLTWNCRKLNPCLLLPCCSCQEPQTILQKCNLLFFRYSIETGPLAHQIYTSHPFILLLGYPTFSSTSYTFEAIYRGQLTHS